MNGNTRNTIRLVSLMLALLMLAALLGACARQGEGDEVTTTAASGAAGTDSDSIPETTEYDYYAGIPDDLKYDNYTFNILSYDAATWNVYLDSDTIDGTLLNDAAYMRNLEVQGLLGVDVAVTKIPHAQIIKRIQTENVSGDCTVDLVCFWATTNIATLLTENQVYDWKELEYVKLDAEWYNQTANKAFDIAGKQYLAVSDLTYSVQQNFQFLCNLDLIAANGLEVPYKHVYDGKWTYDKLFEYTKNVYTDSNSSGTPDSGDSFGLATSVNGVSRFVNNWGESPVSVGEDGFVLNIYSDRLVSMVEKMNALLHDSGTYFPESGQEHYNVFNDGRALFEIYTSDPALLLDIEGFKFGYLPYPKYDENQENHITVTHGGIMAVPITVKDAERASAIIEAMSAASTKHIEPAFIDNYIESRVLQDEDSVNMYRLMRSTAFYDLSRSIDPSGYFSGLSYYTKLLKENNSALSSRNAELSRVITRGYGDIFAALTKND